MSDEESSSEEQSWGEMFADDDDASSDEDGPEREENKKNIMMRSNAAWDFGDVVDKHTTIQERVKCLLKDIDLFFEEKIHEDFSNYEMSFLRSIHEQDPPGGLKGTMEIKNVLGTPDFIRHRSVRNIPGKVKQENSPNQDNYAILKTNDAIVIAVCDGHGEFGQWVSLVTAAGLIQVLCEETNMEFQEKIDTCVWNTIFQKCQNIFHPDYQIPRYDKFHAPDMDDSWSDDFESMEEIELDISDFIGKSATTATLIVITKDALQIANVGDSSCGVSTRKDKDFLFKVASKDLRPSDPEEKARIESMGGEVIMPNETSKKARVKPSGTALSRCIGDLTMQEKGLICEPSVAFMKLKKEQVMLACASDGIWDEMNMKKVLNWGFREPSTGMDLIMKTSQERYLKAADGYSDDTTLVLVDLEDARNYFEENAFLC